MSKYFLALHRYQKPMQANKLDSSLEGPILNVFALYLREVERNFFANRFFSLKEG